MVPVSAIVRFPLGVLHIAGNEAGLHAVEDRAVKEERRSFSPLRISRNLKAFDGQIADTLDGDGRLPFLEGFGSALQDKSIGRADVSQIGMKRDRKHERIGQTSGSL